MLKALEIQRMNTKLSLDEYIAAMEDKNRYVKMVYQMIVYGYTAWCSEYLNIIIYLSFNFPFILCSKTDKI